MKKTIGPVQDYWQFLGELKAQFETANALKKTFFELDELCEWAIKNNITCYNDSGERVSIVEDGLGEQQEMIYKKLLKAVRDLEALLASGVECFTLAK